MRTSKIQTKDALENIMGRKSVRKYLPKPVEKEKIEVLLKAGMAAPSGKDVRPWELIVIDDREVLDSMAAVLPYAKMLKEAPMAIVVCGDTTKSSYWYLDCSAVTQNRPCSRRRTNRPPVGRSCSQPWSGCAG